MIALKNSSGMSLAELLAALLVSSIAILTITAVIVKTFTYMNHSSYLEHAGVDSHKSQYFLERLLGQAVGLRLVSEFAFPLTDAQKLLDSFDQNLIANNNNISYLDGPATYEDTGIIRHFDSRPQPLNVPAVYSRNWMSGTNQRIMTLALFQSEQALAGTDRSSFHSVGIFFQYPTVTTPGVLYIDVQPGGGAVTPSRSSYTISGIEYMTITPYTVSDPVSLITENAVESVQFEIMFRIQSQDNPLAWNWCHDDVLIATVPECFGNIGPSRKVQRNFTIQIDNLNKSVADDGTAVFKKGVYYFPLRRPTNALK